MAQGRSTNIISMIKWIRFSRMSIKNSLSSESEFSGLFRVQKVRCRAAAQPPPPWCRVSGLRVEGSAFRVQRLFRVYVRFISCSSRAYFGLRRQDGNSSAAAPPLLSSFRVRDLMLTSGLEGAMSSSSAAASPLLSGFRVQGAGFRVQGAGFRVRGAGFSGIGAVAQPPLP